MNNKSYYIAIDGVDGTGKSTQTKKLCNYFDDMGYAVAHTFEPGGTDLGKKLRSLILDKKNIILPEAELLLFCADRCEQQHKVQTLLNKKITVISDRFLSSTWAYQIYGRGCDRDLLEYVSSKTVKVLPDLTIILDIDVDLALSRSRGRLMCEGKTVSEGRFEAEKSEFFKKVRQGFIKYSESEKYGKCVLIDASGSEEEVFDLIKSEVKNRLLNERS